MQSRGYATGRLSSTLCALSQPSIHSKRSRLTLLFPTHLFEPLRTHPILQILWCLRVSSSHARSVRKAGSSPVVALCGCPPPWVIWQRIFQSQAYRTMLFPISDAIHSVAYNKLKQRCEMRAPRQSINHRKPPSCLQQAKWPYSPSLHRQEPLQA
jgi:hypothetical protein